MALIDRLKAAIAAQGVTVKDAAESSGTCASPYAVVRDGGVSPRGPTTGTKITLVTLYAPYREPDQLADIKGKTLTALLGAGQKLSGVTENDIDNTYKAAACEIQVYTLCAI